MSSRISKYWTQEYTHLLNTPGINLTDYETRVVISLLVEGEKSASDLSQLTDIPRTKVYDVLNSLMERKLVSKVDRNFDVNVSMLENILDKLDFIYDDFKSGFKSIIENKGEGSLGILSKEISEILHSLSFKIEELPIHISDNSKAYISRAPLGYTIVFVVDVGSPFQYGQILRELRYLKEDDDATFGVFIHTIDIDKKSIQYAKRHNLKTIYHDLNFDKNMRYIIYEMEDLIRKNKEEFNRLSKEIDLLNKEIMTLKEGIFEIDSLVRDNTDNFEVDLINYDFILKETSIQMESLISELNQNRVTIEKNMDDGNYNLVKLDIEKIHRIMNDLKSIQIKSINTINEIKKKAYLKKENPYISYGLSNNPFYQVIPDQTVEGLVNQRNLIDTIIEDFDNHIKNNSASISFITGTYGSGKSHLLYYLINSLKSKNEVLASYTKSSVNLIEIFTNFINQSIKTINEEIKFYYNKPDNIYELLDVIDKHVILLREFKHANIFWFIDEFDLFNQLNQAQKNNYFNQLRHIIDHILELGFVNIIFTLTKENYNYIRNNHISITQRIDKVYEINLLSENDVEDFINFYITNFSIINAATKVIPKFSQEIHKNIIKYSSGIPRIMKKICADLFDYAIINDINIITNDILYKVIQYVHIGKLVADPSVSYNLELDYFYGLNMILGSTGSGKTNLARNISLEMGKRKNAVFILAGSNSYYEVLNSSYENIRIIQNSSEYKESLIEGLINVIDYSQIIEGDDQLSMVENIRNNINHLFEYLYEYREMHNDSDIGISVFIDDVNSLMLGEEFKDIVRTCRKYKISICILSQSLNIIDNYEIFSNIQNYFIFQQRITNEKEIKMFESILPPSYIDNLNHITVGQCYVISPHVQQVQLVNIPFKLS